MPDGSICWTRGLMVSDMVVPPFWMVGSSICGMWGDDFWVWFGVEGVLCCLVELECCDV